jgi:hypothetical protein
MNDKPFIMNEPVAPAADFAALIALLVSFLS